MVTASSLFLAGRGFGDFAERAITGRRWLAGQAGAGFAVAEAESYQPAGRDIYRFFELFDLPQISGWQEAMQAAAAAAG
jgi:hypothetical protein